MAIWLYAKHNAIIMRNTSMLLISFMHLTELKLFWRTWAPDITPLHPSGPHTKAFYYSRTVETIPNTTQRFVKKAAHRQPSNNMHKHGNTIQNTHIFYIM